MKIIMSPAKNMKIDVNSMEYLGLPEYMDLTEKILQWLQNKSMEELQELWCCNDKIAKRNFERVTRMDLYRNLTPAILSYEGIAYQYMAPVVFEDSQFDYVQEHLRIFSAFYGPLKPMDGVTPYRLEMQAKAAIENHRNLYQFWGDRFYKAVKDEDGVIINLASKEYSHCVERYLSKEDTMITCIFGEMVKGKMMQKPTYAKMARGEMVRYMAENKIEVPQDIKNFNRLGFIYREDLSSEKEYVFERIG